MFYEPSAFSAKNTDICIRTKRHELQYQVFCTFN